MNYQTSREQLAELLMSLADKYLQILNLQNNK